MMKTRGAEKVYELFDSFIENCLIKNNSLLSDHTNIFSLENIREVKKIFIDGRITDSGESYWEKIDKQFKDSSWEVSLCFAHFNWLWALAADDITVNGKKEALKKILEKKYKELAEEVKKRDIFSKKGVGSSGIYHKTNKAFEITFLIILSIDIKQKIEKNELKGLDSIKKFIQDTCLSQLYDNEENSESDYKTFTNEKFVAMRNILLHLTNPGEYEPIASGKDKDKILDAFYESLSIENSSQKNDYFKERGFKEDNELKKDEKILLIRKVIEDLTKESGFSFYEDKYSKIWSFDYSNKKFSPLQALIFKKAIIFYGPPGTGKTYEANQTAAALITKFFVKDKTRLKKYLINKRDMISSRIHEFQFNPNISYEEFIVGYEIDNYSTKVKNGKLMDVITIATNETILAGKEKKTKMPHVVILDEINRVDLSRVLGEVFSLIEYRNKKINTAVKGVSISIPDNLYFIGTMNEIDFSLERVDFALMRRFIWIPVQFDKEALVRMLDLRFKEINKPPSEEEIIEFANRCDKLNQYISIDRKEELGEKFQVGHAFFADIADIYAQQLVLSQKGIGILKESTLEILWLISIGPLLDSYLGNIEPEEKSKYLSEAHNLLLYGQKAKNK